MRRRLTRLVGRRKRVDDEINEAIREAVEVLDVVEVAKLLGMTPPGLYKRLDKLGVHRPKRGETKEPE